MCAFVRMEAQALQQLMGSKFSRVLQTTITSQRNLQVQIAMCTKHYAKIGEMKGDKLYAFMFFVGGTTTGIELTEELCLALCITTGQRISSPEGRGALRVMSQLCHSWLVDRR